MIRHHAWVGPCLVALTACATPPAAPDRDRGALLRSTRDALEGVLAPDTSTQAIEAARREATKWDDAAMEPSGLLESLALLAAVAAEDEARRASELVRFRGEAEDEVLRKVAAHLLESNELYLARELEEDAFYSVAARFLNDAWQAAWALVNTNPFGFLSNVVDGVSGVVAAEDVDARDRKIADLHRRWLLAHGDEQAPPGLRERIRVETERLERETLELELFLAERLMETRRPDAAAAHVHAARILYPRSEDVGAAMEAVEKELRGRRDRLLASLEIDPIEIDMARLDPGLARFYRSLVEWLLLSGGDPPGSVPRWRGLALDVEQRAMAVGHGPLEAAVGRAVSILDDHGDSYFRVEQARSEERRRRFKYVLTGERTAGDPLLRYRTARTRMDRSAVDVAAAALFIPGILVRLGSLAFTEPVGDRAVVDALAGYVRRTTAGRRRDDALRELSRRYLAQGEPLKALAAARESQAGVEEIDDIREAVADSLLEHARIVAPGPERRRSLSMVAETYPETRAASCAVTLLDAVVEEQSNSSRMLPAQAVRAHAAELGIDLGHVDGRVDNGEVDLDECRLEGQHVSYVLTGDGFMVRRAVLVDTALRERLDAVAAESEWRHRALRSDTYHDLHEGVPVGLVLGIGTAGIAIYPALFPETYGLSDRSLFE